MRDRYGTEGVAEGRPSEEKVDIEGLLRSGQTIQIRLRGYSMYPLFVPGRDEVRIAPLGSRRLKRGEVVLYRREKGILVLHRIWRRGKEGICLVGDNQKEIEGPLAESQMRGVMVGFVRKGKYHSVSNLFYRIYAFVWLFLRPVRPGISHMAAFFLHRNEKN